MSPSIYSLLKSILTDQAKKRPTAQEIVDKLAELELDLDTTRVPDRPNSKLTPSNPLPRCRIEVRLIDFVVYPLASIGGGRSKSGNGPMSSPNDIHRTVSGGPPLPQHRFGPSRYKSDYEEVEKLVCPSIT